MDSLLFYKTNETNQGPLVSLHQGQWLSVGEEKLKVNCLKRLTSSIKHSHVQSAAGLDLVGS